MDVYLAAVASCNSHVLVNWNDCSSLYLLESFWYSDNDTVKKYIPQVGKFLLDSGAFTFMANNKNKIDWDDYVERYADFINKNNVNLFFELDIDSLVGISEVERLRGKLERLTGKRCIPVWHKSRGKDYFLRMCDRYGYVSLGGIVSGEIVPEEYKYFPWFINTAHEHGAKIHGLGFTNFAGLKKYHFDSVDSASWTSGHRFGSVCRFKDGIMTNVPKKGKGRMIDWKSIAEHNFNEWVKFQKYAKTHL